MNVLMQQQILCSLVEKVINALLTMDSQAKLALAPLEQKTLSVKLNELEFPLCFSVNEQQIMVTSISERSDCCIETSIDTLKELKRSQQLTELIKQDKLDISGDIKVAQCFSAVFENIDIDWQSELAKHIGDIPTYKLQQFSQWLGSKFAFAKQQISADASEWLVQEKQLTVTEFEIASFSNDIKQVQSELKALEERIQSLQVKAVKDELAKEQP